jgi:hypothetical protein
MMKAVSTEIAPLGSTDVPRLAASHAGVKTLGDDIGQAIIDDDLDFDVRIPPQQLRQFRP